MLQPTARDDQTLHAIIKGLTSESQLLSDDLQRIYTNKQNNLPINLHHFSQTSMTIYNKLVFQGFQNKDQFDNLIDKMVKSSTRNYLNKLK